MVYKPSPLVGRVLEGRERGRDRMVVDDLIDTDSQFDPFIFCISHCFTTNDVGIQNAM